MDHISVCSFEVALSICSSWCETARSHFLCFLCRSFIGRKRPLQEDERDDFTLVINASLTLPALIIGFSFSMAVSRQRKNYEEEEANAIGTEYVRADLLPAPDGAKVRNLLEQSKRDKLTRNKHDDTTGTVKDCRRGPLKKRVSDRRKIAVGNKAPHLIPKRAMALVLSSDMAISSTKHHF